MKTNKSTIIILAILLILLVVGNIFYDKLTGNYNGNNGNIVTSSDDDKEQAADFDVVDNNDKEVKLSDKKGKPVVVNFWASWCGPCKSEMPDFDEAYEKYGEDVEFMMVNMTDGNQETKSVASKFIKGQGYKFPVYYDVNMSAAKAYNVTAIPATYFIDKDGYIVSSAKGAINSNALEEGIKKINK